MIYENCSILDFSAFGESAQAFPSLLWLLSWGSLLPLRSELQAF